MSKKYIIILVIVIVAAAGLYLYLNNKKEKDLRSHNNRQYTRITEVAKKSSIAGLVQMAEALNKYKEKNGVYPAKLSALHPDFIPLRAFIDDIQWHYKPNSKDFHLSKAITTKKGKVLTASIGPDLKLQKKTKTMAASAEVAKQTTSRVKTKSSKKSHKTGTSVISRAKPKPMASAIRPDIPSAGLKNSRGKSDSSVAQVISKKKPEPDPALEIEKTRTHKLTEKEQFIHGVNQKFLIWKNADGSLGFSNIQYPESQELSVYDQGEWVQISRQDLYAKSKKHIQQHKNK